MKLLVTGASGLLGGNVVALARDNHNCIGVDISDLDITDRDAVKSKLEELRPRAVLHCAAYTDVDGAETDEATAMAVNAQGTEWLARAARQVGALLAYVSTDYVFDGTQSRPYREDDPTRPLSRYGISKLEGEHRVAGLCPEDHLIVRTAWLYGAGRGFPDWVCRRLDEGGALRLVSNHQGSPTYAADLARALVLLVEQDRRGFFHFVNKGKTSWLGFGRAIAELTGHPEAVVEEVKSSELGRPALRPAYSVLAVDKYESVTGDRVPSWRDALKRYLAAVGRLSR